MIGRDGLGDHFALDLGAGDAPAVLRYDHSIGDFDEEAPSILAHVEAVVAEYAEERATRED